VHAAESFEDIAKKSVEVYDLVPTLRPFVATCKRKKTHFSRLFCSALNERLKAQHQAKLYRYTSPSDAAGPLVVRFSAKPKPVAELTVVGCLTCKEPLLARAGGDITDGRFFLFKEPKMIALRRGKGPSPYRLSKIDVGSYALELPPGTTEKTFKREVLPFLRLDLLYRPVAGVTKVGGRFKYGVLVYELVGHRVYDRCTGKVAKAVPAMAGGLEPDKTDPSCPQNRTAKVVKRVVLPAQLPKAEVSRAMKLVSADLHTCYSQFGVAGDVPIVMVAAPSGEVSEATVIGKLAGSESGRCVERLVKAARLPKFKGDPARLQWPLKLKE
jgi:hypothetical protein